MLFKSDFRAKGAYCIYYSYPLGNMGQSFQLYPPDPIDIGDGRWKYRDEWYDKTWWHKGLDALLDADGANVTCSMLFTFYGLAAHRQIRSLNTLIARLKKGDPDRETESYVSQLLWDLDGICGPCNGGFRQERLCELIEDELDAINFRKAPSALKKQAQEVIELISRGIALYEDTKAYLIYRRDEIAARQKAKRSGPELLSASLERPAMAQAQGGMPSENSKWEQIEIRHSSVRDGFVYIMSNRMMPGIYKIGFTVRNPDERAKEVTAEVSLPLPFVVEKYWRTYDPFIVEQRIFRELAYCRVGEKHEFFEGDIEEIGKAIERLLIRTPT